MSCLYCSHSPIHSRRGLARSWWCSSPPGSPWATSVMSIESGSRLSRSAPRTRPPACSQASSCRVATGKQWISVFPPSHEPSQPNSARILCPPSKSHHPRSAGVKWDKSTRNGPVRMSIPCSGPLGCPWPERKKRKNLAPCFIGVGYKIIDDKEYN